MHFEVMSEEKGAKEKALKRIIRENLWLNYWYVQSNYRCFENVLTCHTILWDTFPWIILAKYELPSMKVQTWSWEKANFLCVKSGLSDLTFETSVGAQQSQSRNPQIQGWLFLSIICLEMQKKKQKKKHVNKFKKKKRNNFIFIRWSLQIKDAALLHLIYCSPEFDAILTILTHLQYNPMLRINE